eukprot:656122-Amphidinium_carterae.1
MSPRPRTTSQERCLEVRVIPSHADVAVSWTRNYNACWHWLSVRAFHSTLAGPVLSMTLSYVHGKLVVTGHRAAALDKRSQHETMEWRRRCRSARVASLRHYPVGHLKALSVSAATRRRYEAGATRIKLWAQHQRRNMRAGCDWDRLFADYLNHAHLEGESLNTARYDVFGLAWLRDLALAKSRFPRTFATFKGWQKSQTERQRPPVPEDVVFAMSRWLIEASGSTMGLQVGYGLLVQLDLYLRPSE